MPFIQFRIHPSGGSARVGNSDKAYCLASEFPQCLQEEFANLRLHPKPRHHPVFFFKGNTTVTSATISEAHFKSSVAPNGFGGVYDTTAAHQNRFKDTNGRIF